LLITGVDDHDCEAIRGSYRSEAVMTRAKFGTPWSNQKGGRFSNHRNNGDKVDVGSRAGCVIAVQ